jgi:hypothetical protein
MSFWIANFFALKAHASSCDFLGMFQKPIFSTEGTGGSHAFSN